MKWRHWSILIVLVLLNYIIFSTAFSQLAEQRQADLRRTRTPAPTFAQVEATPLAWVVLPTSTPQPTRTPITPRPSETPTVAASETPAPAESGTPATEVPAASATPEAASATPEPTSTPQPPTETPAGEAVIHVIKRGETLSEIAKLYGVTVQAIVEANGIEDPGRIITGQELIIPAPGQVPPSATPGPAPTKQPTATRRPATATSQPPAATPTSGSFQFTAEVIWDPWVAPNCSGPAIAKQSIIRDASGNPINGVRVEVDCYGNTWLSHASGTPGEYEPGHYDFVFGQSSPQDWTCTARVYDVDGQPVASSEVVSITFDTNDCKPNGSGHQVAIVNWTKQW